MVLAIVALVLALPQLAGYAVTRLWSRAGWVEWLAAVVASYTAIWYATLGSLTRSLQSNGTHCGVGPQAQMMGWSVLLAGLVVEVLMGAVLAGMIVRRKQPPAPPSP